MYSVYNILYKETLMKRKRCKTYKGIKQLAKDAIKNALMRDDQRAVEYIEAYKKLNKGQRERWDKITGKERKND